MVGERASTATLHSLKVAFAHYKCIGEGYICFQKLFYILRIVLTIGIYRNGIAKALFDSRTESRAQCFPFAQVAIVMHCNYSRKIIKQNGCAVATPVVNDDDVATIGLQFSQYMNDATCIIVSRHNAAYTSQVQSFVYFALCHCLNCFVCG